MLPKSKRLTRRDFESVLKKGVVYHSPFFTLKFYPVNQQLRFAVVVPSKIVKKASQRNLFRRSGYSAVREIIKTTRFQGAAILFFKKTALTLRKEILKAEVERIIKSGLKQT